MAPFERFAVIPSIDLKGGAVVRLLRGDMTRATVYGDDPAASARGFEADGARAIHIVDLDGAIAGQPKNLELMRQIRAAVKCQLDFSGGLRTLESIQAAFDAGANLVALGSAAFLDAQLLRRACEVFPARVLGSLDARSGRLAIKGWVESSELTVSDAARRFRDAGVAAIVYTDIARDGAESGVDAEKNVALAREVKLPVIASGGVASLSDIRALSAHYHDGIVGVVIGRALYEGRFTLADAISAAAGQARQ